jgi:hypothetical protein
VLDPCAVVALVVVDACGVDACVLPPPVVLGGFGVLFPCCAITGCAVQRTATAAIVSLTRIMANLPGRPTARDIPMTDLWRSSRNAAARISCEVRPGAAGRRMITDVESR